MGRAGRQKGEALPELRELREEGLPEGWNQYWHGKKEEIARSEETHTYRPGKMPPPFPDELPPIPSQYRQDVGMLIGNMVPRATGRNGAMVVPPSGPFQAARRLDAIDASMSSPVAQKLAFLYGHWKNELGDDLFGKAYREAGTDRFYRSFADYLGGDRRAFEKIIKDPALTRTLAASMPKEKYQIVAYDLTSNDVAMGGYKENPRISWDLVPLSDGMP